MPKRQDDDLLNITFPGEVHVPAAVLEVINTLVLTASVEGKLKQGKTCLYWSLVYTLQEHMEKPL